MNKATRRRILAAAATAAVGILVLTACSSDDSTTSASDGSESTEASTAAAEILGAENKATGTPVKVGLVSDGKSAAIDNTQESDAAKAAVAYINTYLGGIAGHPIDLVTCETGQTPSGATDCATKMVDDKVAAVLVGASGQSSSIFTGLGSSGIPYFTFANFDRDALTKPGAFILTNGLATLAGPAKLAQDKGLEKAAVVVIDVPAASGPYSQIGPIIYGNAGISLDIAAVPPDTADPTPQIQAKISAGAQQFSVVGSAPFCTGALKAMKSLGFTGDIVVITQCLDTGSGSSIPGGYEGMSVVSSTTDDPNDKDVKLYSAVMDEYASGTAKGGVAPGGFIVTVAFARALQSLTGEVNAASVTSTLSAMPTPVELPMGGGITIQCGSKPVAVAPNVCARDVLVATLSADGTGGDHKVLDTSAIAKLPG